MLTCKLCVNLLFNHPPSLPPPLSLSLSLPPPPPLSLTHTHRMMYQRRSRGGALKQYLVLDEKTTSSESINPVVPRPLHWVTNVYTIFGLRCFLKGYEHRMTCLLFVFGCLCVIVSYWLTVHYCWPASIAGTVLP